MIRSGSPILPGHQAAKGMIARQGADHPPLQRSQPRRQQLQPMLPHRQARAVLGLHDVAVPAHADVVNQIEVERAELLLGGHGAADLRVDPAQAMGDDRQPLAAAAHLLRHHVDFVSAGQQSCSVLAGPALGPAQPRIERVDDQSDFHRDAPMLSGTCSSRRADRRGGRLPGGQAHAARPHLVTAARVARRILHHLMIQGHDLVSRSARNCVAIAMLRAAMPIVRRTAGSSRTWTLCGELLGVAGVGDQRDDRGRRGTARPRRWQRVVTTGSPQAAASNTTRLQVS